jgi:hypothetical protein
MSKSRKQLKLVIKDGEITSIYDDALVPLIEQSATVETTRASHVEPSKVAWFGWCADLSPIGGPRLTFKTRQEALDAEVQYINRHVIT